MPKKRYRDFKRIAMSAKTAAWLSENLVDKTFKDHAEKCMTEGLDEECAHEESGSLYAAKAVAVGLKIGKKRATLDLKCPYSTNDPQHQIRTLEVLAERILAFAKSTHGMRQDACKRIVEEIQAYARRNAMQVIAEAAR